MDGQHSKEPGGEAQRDDDEGELAAREGRRLRRRFGSRQLPESARLRGLAGDHADRGHGGHRQHLVVQVGRVEVHPARLVVYVGALVQDEGHAYREEWETQAETKDHWPVHDRPPGDVGVQSVVGNGLQKDEREVGQEQIVERHGNQSAQSHPQLGRVGSGLFIAEQGCEVHEERRPGHQDQYVGNQKHNLLHHVIYPGH